MGGTPIKDNGKVREGSIEFSTGKAIALFLAVGGALSYFFNREKRRLETQKEAEANRGYGKPSLGDPSIWRICMAMSLRRKTFSVSFL